MHYSLSWSRLYNHSMNLELKYCNWKKMIFSKLIEGDRNRQTWKMCAYWIFSKFIYWTTHAHSLRMQVLGRGMFADEHINVSSLRQALILYECICKKTGSWRDTHKQNIVCKLEVWWQKALHCKTLAHVPATASFLSTFRWSTFLLGLYLWFLVSRTAKPFVYVV